MVLWYDSVTIEEIHIRNISLSSQLEFLKRGLCTSEIICSLAPSSSKSNFYFALNIG